jgi:hypothetical protein
MAAPAQAASTAPKATPAAATSPSTESSQVTTAATESAANGTDSQAEATTAQPAWKTEMLAADRDEVLRELLDSTDSDRLLKQPKLSGLLGDLAERRARAKEVEIERKVTERQEQARLRTLRDEDPYAYAQEHKRKEDEAAQAESDGAAHQRTLVTWATDINNEIGALAQTLPREIVEKLSTKKYEGTLGQGIRQYMSDIIDASKEAWTTEAHAKFTKDILPTLRKEALAKVNGGVDDIPDTGSGASAAGALNHEEWQRNGKDRAWRTANKQRINDALANGRIRPLS